MAIMLTATAAEAASIVYGFDRDSVGFDRVSAIDPITGQVSDARPLTVTSTIAGTSGPVIVTTFVSASYLGFVSAPGGKIYGIDQNAPDRGDRIGTIDPLTGAVSDYKPLTNTFTIAGSSGPVIVTTNVTTSFTGFAAAPGGQVYAFDRDPGGLNRVRTIDPLTGAVSDSRPLTITSTIPGSSGPVIVTTFVNGPYLGFVSATGGKVYGIDQNAPDRSDQISAIEPLTGAVSDYKRLTNTFTIAGSSGPVIVTTNVTTPFTGFAAAPGGQVYAFDRDPSLGSNRIRTIDPLTGAVSDFMPLIRTFTIPGTSGPVIVTTNVTAAYSGFVAIDSGTGGSGGGSAVPEPAGLVLFGCAIAALSVSRRRGAA